MCAAGTVEPEPSSIHRCAASRSAERSDAGRVRALGAAVGQRVEHGLRWRVARRTDRQVDETAGQRRRRSGSACRGGRTDTAAGRSRRRSTRRRRLDRHDPSAPPRRAPTPAGRPTHRTVVPAPSRTPRPPRSTRPRPRGGRRRARRRGRTGSANSRTTVSEAQPIAQRAQELVDVLAGRRADRHRTRDDPRPAPWRRPVRGRPC